MAIKRSNIACLDYIIDNLREAAVKKYLSKGWVKIAEFIPNRTPRQ